MKGIIIVALISTSVLATGRKSICGPTDDRVLSDDLKIARASKANQSVGCTITMIGRSCALSVGHCVDVLEKAQFNVPVSASGNPGSAKEEDTYYRDKDFLRYENGGEGNDWAVVRYKKNAITGKLPGDVQGFYPIGLTRKPRKGDIIRITGFGVDENDPDISFSQQTNIGSVISVGGWFKKSLIKHNVDTMGGNSGSTIILENTGEIVGVHSHGGCNSWGSNQGTLIASHKTFKSAIKQCLDWERSLP